MAVILAVDDDPDVLDLLAFALEPAGHEVLTAADGPAAISVAGSRSVDLVVTDFHMPGMTGVQLAEQLRSVPGTRTAPVVVVSAATGPDNDSSSLVSRWLSKPFSPRALRAEIGDVLSTIAPS